MGGLLESTFENEVLQEKILGGAYTSSPATLLGTFRARVISAK